MDIKTILQEIAGSNISLDTKESLISNLGDKNAVEKSLNEIKEESIYRAIMSKPLMTGHDILKFPSQPNDYLIEKFLWKSSIAFIVGAEKACKSIFTTQQAMALTVGDNFLGCFDVTRPLKVLYVQAEGNMGETRERFESSISKGGLRWNPDNWRHFFPPALALDTDLDKKGEVLIGGFTDFCNRIDAAEFTPEVIVIDPLYMSIDGDLNDNRAARQFCRNIRRLHERYGCAIIIVHHEHRPRKDKFHNKIEEGDNAIYGSAMWKNFASHVLRISMVNERGNPISPEREETAKVKYRKVACHTQRSDNVIKRIVLKLKQDPLMFEVMTSASGSASEDAVYRCIMAHEPIAACEVAEMTGINIQTVHSCFTRLYKRRNKIRIHSHKGNKTMYCIRELEDEQTTATGDED